MDALIKAMDGQAGDLLLFAADKDKVVFDVLGNLRLHIAKQYDMIDKSQYKFLWVTEFPLLEWSDEQNRLHSKCITPFYKCHFEERSLKFIDEKTRRCPCESIRYRIKMVQNLVVDQSVSIRMIFRRRCLKLLDLQKKMLTTVLDSY